MFNFIKNLFSNKKNDRMVLRSKDGRFAGSLPAQPKFSALPVLPLAPIAEPTIQISMKASIKNRVKLSEVLEQDGVVKNPITATGDLSDIQVYNALVRSGVKADK